MHVWLSWHLAPVRGVRSLIAIMDMVYTNFLMAISTKATLKIAKPLAAFTLEPEDYGSWIATWSQIGAPMAMVLEGGYVPSRVADAALESVAALTHVR